MQHMSTSVDTGAECTLSTSRLRRQAWVSTIVACGGERVNVEKATVWKSHKSNNMQSDNN